MEYPEEANQLLIPENEVTENISEGDIVKISKIDSGYEINVLKGDTENIKDKVSILLEKLKKIATSPIYSKWRMWKLILAVYKF